METYIAIIVTATFMILLGYIVPKFWSVSLSTRKSIVLDTSALIDGRVLEVVHSGFLQTQLIIPQFVLSELQLLADKGDTQKRARARYGLDVVQELQDSGAEVVIDETDIKNKTEVDDKLVSLAKKRGALLYTTDFNLNKIAEIEGVKVLNVNELSQALRPVALPGETIEVKILQKGSNKNQGVAHLDDGTMVVVDGASRRVGKKVMVSVSRNLQTNAGRMIFANIVKSSPAKKSARKK